MIKFILAFFISVNLSFAASWGVVTSEKAIVFADPDMKSKIGFLSQGKKIRIGDVAKNKGQVYPFVYQNRIVYIKKIDIQTSAEILALQSAMERVTKNSLAPDRFQRIALGFFMGQFRLTGLKNYSEEMSKSILFSGVNLAGHLVKPAKRQSTKLQVNYIAGKDGAEDFSLFNIEFAYMFNFFSYKRISFDGYGSLILTPHFGYSYRTEFSESGSGYGTGIGIESTYRLDKRWSVHLDSQIRYQKVSVNLPKDISLGDFKSNIFGLNGILSLSYAYE